MTINGYDFPEFEAGSVWLCGAGPGDPGLITLLAYHGLREADYIVYDALVDEGILSMANPNAQLEFAGKRGGKPSPKQRDISAQLVKLAQAGHKVLRLKGGDPFVFGRGGEEALSLVANKVAFRVIPGISSGVGGLAYAGIPLTHRDVNSAVTLVTGHAVTGNVPDNLDWTALAAASPVLILYMGMKHLPEIRQRLIAGGRGTDEPVAIISDVATVRQRNLHTTLKSCVEDATEADMKPPSIIVVGRVAELASGLDWLGALQTGKTLVANPLGLEESACA